MLSKYDINRLSRVIHLDVSIRANAIWKWVLSQQLSLVYILCISSSYQYSELCYKFDGYIPLTLLALILAAWGFPGQSVLILDSSACPWGVELHVEALNVLHWYALGVHTSQRQSLLRSESKTSCLLSRRINLSSHY